MPTERKKPTRRPPAQHLPFLTIILLLLIAFYALHGPVRAWLSGRYRAVSTFDKALGIILDEYVDPISPEEVLPDAVDGMVKALKDRHSHLLRPKAHQRLKEAETGKYAGIGVLIMPFNGQVVIHEVFNGSPAQAAGLRPGDAILAADGHDLTGVEKAAAAGDHIRGEEDTKVELRIARGRERFDVTITRRRIARPVVQHRRHEPAIGYIRVYDFPSEVAQKVENALEELCQQRARSLVLDLRGNSGGFLDEAIQVADLFIAEGVIVTTRSRHERDNRIERAEPGGPAEDLPIIVLVNRATASAAEVVAGALQDHGRARLLGEQTFGKGAVNKRFPLAGGLGLLITTGRYYLPKGRQIEGKGLIPDIKVAGLTKKDFERLRPGDKFPDPQLDAALKLLRGGTAPPPPPAHQQ